MHSIASLLDKAIADTPLSKKELITLFQTPLFSRDAALIHASGREKSWAATKGYAEVHAQIGINIAPCPKNCKFCSFSADNKVFTTSHELSVDEVIVRVRQFHEDGANAVYLMVTADYAFDRFINIGTQVHQALPDVVLIANVGDFTRRQADDLCDAGFTGVYHAVRLGEGRDTRIPVEKRLETFQHAHEAGLLLGTCVEPVGTEHTVQELMEKTLITRDARPVYSGAARRIPIPNTVLAQYGWVKEAQMALYVSIVRLALPLSIPGNCTHEPNLLGAWAGANLLWAEVGANPRDNEQETEQKRGMNVAECRKVFEETNWKILQGPSKLYQKPLIYEA